MKSSYLLWRELFMCKTTVVGFFIWLQDIEFDIIIIEVQNKLFSEVISDG